MTEPTDDQNDAAGDAPRGTRLTGWKEIAAYLDKAVRTVQRWERDFDLPVRRASEDRASSVYAFTAELEAWLRSPAGTRAGRQERLDAEAAGPSAEAPPPTVPSPRPRQRVHWVTWVLAATVLLLVGDWAWRAWQPGPRSKPATWKVEGDTLTVFDNADRILFTHAFGMPLNASFYVVGTRDSEKYSGTDDIDGDGRYEFWFVASPVRPTAASIQEVYVFDHDGTVRWRYRFSGSVTFGPDRFDPPWSPRFVYVTDRPEGGAGRALWVSSVERTAYPSVLQRLDVGTGLPLSSYWSNGYISSVALGTLGRRKVLLVGGSFNDAKCSSLAVLDPMNPNGSAPAERAKYRCGNCPPGSPLAFVLFPKPARFAPLDTSGSVFSIDAAKSDDVVVKVGHALAADDYATVVYRLDGQLRPTWIDTADGYLRAYETLVRQGVLPPGTSTAIDPATEYPPPLYWAGGNTFAPAGK